MTKITPSLFLAILLGLSLHVVSAQAQYIRTCVSANGDDANTCHCTQPCRTLTRAHFQTLSDGEITVLDPGSYGPVLIKKSISIVNDGVGEASIAVTDASTGITINAPPGGYVNLRGLTIQGVGVGGNGLTFNTGFSLTMTNCVIRNLTGFGIVFQPNASSNLSVSNTLVADNGQTAIIVQPSGAGTVKTVFNRVEVYNNSTVGIWLIGNFSTGTIKGTVADSMAGNNGGAGFAVSSTSGKAATSLMVVRSETANNGAGISVDGSPAVLRIGQSTVTGNGASWSAPNGGGLRSYGDNNIDGNGDGDPAIPTVIPKK